MTSQPPNDPRFEASADPSPARACRIGGGFRSVVDIGRARPLAIIAGPCVLESRALGLEVGERLRDQCAALGLAYIFKASYDKANRSSISSPRGPGLRQGLEWLAAIGDTLGVPVTTDIHEPDHAAPAAAAVDLLQIPAFLCRQTDLLAAAGDAARAASDGPREVGVSVKKGQFLSPREMRGPVRKLAEAGCRNVLLIERGTFFGYHRLVTDLIGLGDLIELDCADPGSPDPDSPPVCFDATHSCQLPGAGEQTGGRRDRSPMLARAAIAAGVHALFMEVHPDPGNALSDASTQLPYPMASEVLGTASRLRHALADVLNA